MALIEDAVSSSVKPFTYNFRSIERINESVLNEIIQDLSVNEIISIVFLFTDHHTNVSELIQLLEKDCHKAFSNLSKRNNWTDKLLESLVITRNINILKKLGFQRDEINAMKTDYVHDIHNVTQFLNKVVKSLFFLCQVMDQRDTKKLIDEVNKQLSAPVHLEDNIGLEMYILHWIRKDYISVNKNPRLDKLIINLKNIGCLSNFPPDFNFDYWKSSSAFPDSPDQDNSLINRIDTNIDNKHLQSDGNLKNFKCDESKRLCIIINEINFKSGQFKVDSRKEGSMQDEQNLENTFKGCGFKVEKYLNYTTEQMLTLLNKFHEPMYASYSCIFICILSHGYKGAVIFSDNSSIEIDTLIQKFCCSNLRNVFKCIILQSCQGNKLGVVENNLDIQDQLVSDGPEGRALDQIKYFLLQATIVDYKAMRDKATGTWFIQAVCSVIRDYSPMKVSDWSQMVINHVSSRRGNSRFENKKIVQVPEGRGTNTEYVIPRYLKD